MFRTKMILIFMVSVFLFGTSCTKKKALDGKVLNFAVSSDVKGMDPIYSNDRYSSNEVARVYEGLLEYHYLKRPYTLVPNLAESMPTVSADGSTYTFKIKKGIFFHDSPAFKGKKRELVAEDFVYSIKRLADPKLQGLGYWLLDGKIVGLDDWRAANKTADKVDYAAVVEGIKSVDKYTLQFKLKTPFPQFLYALAMPFTFAVAKEVVEFYGKEFLNHPVGTGPYILPEFKQSKKITYTKNPNFRKKKFPTDSSPEFASIAKTYGGKLLPLSDKVIVNIMTESQPRWLNFQKGKVDYIGIPKDNFDSVVTPDKNLAGDLAKKGIELIIASSLDVTYTAFNHDLKLFENVDLRRAMSLSFDVNKSNVLFYNNQALPAQSVVPPGIAGYDKNYVSPYRGPNIQKAKELLKKAGYEGGKGLPEITYDCPSSTVSRQIGEYFKKEMAKIGVNIKVVTNTWPELQKKITKRQVMLYGIAWGADYPDAENFLQLLYGPNRSPGANGSGYKNPEFDALFKKARILQDSPERTAIYEKLNRIAAEQVPWIYGVHRQSFVLRHSYMKNYISTDFEAGQAQYIDIDLEEKKRVLNLL